MSIDTKFADMPIGVRKRWLDWANSHDWGGTSRNYFDVTNELVTFCAARNDHGWFEERQVSRTPRELRDWAGY